MNIEYFLALKPVTRSHISCSENALKLAYSNVEFCGKTPDTPLQVEELKRGKERD